ncbi:MAG: restriction endonuclease subunit S [Marinifilaceae bacterium]
MLASWKEVCLGDVINIKHGYGFKGIYFIEEPSVNVLVTPGNFTIGGGFKSNKLKYYKGPIPEEFILSPNDVIVTMTDLSKQADTLGFSAKVPKDRKYTYLLNQRIGLVSLKSDEYNIDFIYWLLRTDVYQKYIAGSSSGATVKHTSPKKIYSAKLKVPKSKETQKKIAKILSNYDDLIENNLKRIKLLEEKAQQTYEEWFVRMKFPNHENTPVDKATGLPLGWEIKRLAEIADINSSSIKKGFEDDIKYIDIACVSRDRIDNKIDYKYKDAPGRAKRIVTHSDIIWSCVRPNRRSHAVIWNPEENLIASTGFCVISPKQLPTSYLYQFITTDTFVAYLTSRAGGAAYPAVKAIDFLESEILVPSVDIVSEFDNVFKNTLEVSWNLQEQNNKLKEARDILLPRLMTGMIDVNKIL